MRLASFFSEIGWKIDDKAIDQLKAKAAELNRSIGKSAVKIKDQMDSHVAAFKEQQKLAARIEKDHHAALVENIKRTKRATARELAETKRVEREKRQEFDKTQAHKRRVELVNIRHQQRLELAQMRERMGPRSATGGFLGAMTGGAMRALGPALAGFSAFEVGRGVFDIGTTMTGLRSAFTMLTGSSEGAEKQIGFINQEVDRLSLNFKSAAQDYKQLLASAQSRLGVETVQELFSGMQEVGLVLGMTVDQQQRSIRAFSQMASKGKIMSEELVGQLSEAMPGAVEIFAKAMGVSTEELRKMMEDGSALAADVLPKVARHLRTMTTEEQRALAKNSPARRLEALRTAYQRTLLQLGESGVFDVLAKLFDRLTQALIKLQPYIPGIGQAINRLFDIISSVAGVVYDLILALEKFVGLENILYGFLAVKLVGWLFSAGGAVLGLVTKFKELRLAILGASAIGAATAGATAAGAAAGGAVAAGAAGGGLLASVLAGGGKIAAGAANVARFLGPWGILASLLLTGVGAAGIYFGNKSAKEDEEAAKQKVLDLINKSKTSEYMQGLSTKSQTYPFIQKPQMQDPVDVNITITMDENMNLQAKVDQRVEQKQFNMIAHAAANLPGGRF